MDSSAPRRIALYPFSYFDLRRRKWLRARYVASLEQMAERYPCFRIEGAPEIREVPLDPQALTFNPDRRKGS